MRYGGIYETTEPAREYTLDDFVTLNLDKLDRFNHIRGTGLEELEWQGSSDEEGSSDSGDEEEEESEEDEEDDPMGEEDEEEGEEDKEARHAALSQAEKVRQTRHWSSH